MRKCDGNTADLTSRRKCCSRSHRPHQLLRGIQSSTGRFFTIVAEPYPRGLCRRLVQAYTLAIEQKTEGHIYPHLFSGMSDGYGNRINKLYSTRDTSGPCKFGSRICSCVNKCTEPGTAASARLKFVEKSGEGESVPSPEKVHLNSAPRRLKPGYMIGVGTTSVMIG